MSGLEPGSACACEASARASAIANSARCSAAPRAAPLAPGRTRAVTAAEDADSPREMSIPRGHQLAMDAALLTMDSHTAACLIPAPPRAAMRPGSAPVRAMRARAAGAR